MSSGEDRSELTETLERLQRLYESLSRAQEAQQVVDLSVELKCVALVACASSALA